MRKLFLKKTKVKNETDAMKNSITAALQRNPTYQRNASYSDKKNFRGTLGGHLRKYAASYLKPISEDNHNKNIRRICSEISKQHGKSLINSRLRFGTGQKAFNLYLKFLWCLDEKRADPPHCPVDSTILEQAGINGAWTRLDSVRTYMNWIKQIKDVAHNCGFESLQQWELSVWNKNS